MRSLNRVALMGHLAADPEVKITSGGNSLTRFRLATNRDWKNSDGERHEETDYHRIVAWRKLAEICGKHLRKGAGIYLEGKLTNHKYQSADGTERIATEIVADVVNFISLKKSADSNQDEVTLIEVQPEQ
ncbi:single-stranded DNA-binding protein [Candidatus Peregrinibacteria bacterium]|nr:single-stranded DNA-binding protein [Candidatus Peregrinibacteria bacterium]